MGRLEGVRVGVACDLIIVVLLDRSPTGKFNRRYWLPSVGFATSDYTAGLPVCQPGCQACELSPLRNLLFLPPSLEESTRKMMARKELAHFTRAWNAPKEHGGKERVLQDQNGNYLPEGSNCRPAATAAAARPTPVFTIPRGGLTSGQSHE